MNPYPLRKVIAKGQCVTRTTQTHNMNYEPKRSPLYDAVVGGIFGAGAGLVLQECLNNHLAHEVAKNGGKWYAVPIVMTIGSLHGALFGNKHDLSNWWTLLGYGTGFMVMMNNGLHLNCDVHPSKSGLTTLIGAVVMFGSALFRR